MRVLFNDMSYGAAHTALTDTQVVSLLRLLIEGIDFIRRISNGQTPTFHVADPAFNSASHNFLGGKNIRECAHLLKSEERTALLFMLQRMHLLKIDATPPHVENVTGLSTSGIPAYFALHGPHFGALSVFTHGVWEASNIYFRPGLLIGKLRNYPKFTFSHVNQYITSISSFYTQVAPIVQGDNTQILPLQKLSSQLFESESFSAAYLLGSKNDKIANYQIVGGAVAQINGYSPNPIVSSLNANSGKKRNIFFNESISKYVSIDYEKGAFEWHDAKGRHLGEYNYHGVRLDEADLKGRHDIKVKGK